MKSSLAVAGSTLKQCKTFLFDCDGVLWNSSSLIPPAAELLDYLICSGRQVFLITNNSSKSVEQYATKCQSLGLPVTSSNIICSANVTAKFILAQKNKGPLYVVGESGLSKELEKAGIAHFGIGPDISEDSSEPLKNLELNEKVTGVVVGYDSHFNYRKLYKAASYIARGLPFYATNEDCRLPSTGFVIPGTGSLVAAVRTASGHEPVVMGKPHKPIFDVLAASCDLNPLETVMVGDNLQTDIAFGNRFGLHTVCVLTGVTTPELINQVNTDSSSKNLRPSIILNSVGDILNILKDSKQST